MLKQRKSKFAAILSVLVCCCMMLSGTAFAMGSGSSNSCNASMLQAAATQYLQQVGGNENLRNPLDLYNLDDQLECVAYEAGADGFLIINVKSYAIVEYSPTGGSPFHKIAAEHPGARLYYNGPLAYYYGSGADARSNGGALITAWDNGQTYDKNAFTTRYVDTSKPFNTARGAANSTQYWFPTQRWSNYDSNGNNHHMCVPVATAIFLKYYQDTFSYEGKYRYLPAFMLNESGDTLRNDLMQYLVDDNHLYLCDTDPNELSTINTIPGDGTYLGLAAYFQDETDCPYAPYLSDFNWDSVTARLRVKKPELLVTNPGYPDGGPTLANGAHMSVLVGYQVLSDGTQQLIINDGWGNSKHIIGLHPSYMQGWMYIQ